MDIQTRVIQENELPAALALVERVFLLFEAPDYSQQGIDTFRTFLQNREMVAELKLLGAFVYDALVGVLAMRGGSHIALFFVEREMQGKGVGRALFSAARAACPGDFMTVNSSPYAVDVYRRFGFEATAPEQVNKGIRFVPMKLSVND